MSVSALNGISKHTKFVILPTTLQTKQTWKKTEGYSTSQDLERRKKENLSWLNFFESNNAVQLCDLRPICWFPTVPFGRSVGLSLLFYNAYLWNISEVRRKVCSFEPWLKLINHWFKTFYIPNRTLNAYRHKDADTVALWPLPVTFYLLVTSSLYWFHPRRL